uniref:Response regulatory domain-containing protein n=1 Tax=Chromera velia CCMP2878 TaxID=1169474 RepID=A0A0G4H1L6_9ALVE|eukprot:Cvel_24316.t1-p1 / transcript=Cvel_24316.t1 / gene=Cvel_24316 / organism=Chromera_velia_CCMP2878 / gene_product=hypothetical protein / transcript_product=hypothetical protein / location=Cvel_scaffold2613:19571-19876(-) / protein_length=102 / sequence_SO=supercontig / SO=protein_coding / is_pseudo=false
MHMQRSLGTTVCKQLRTERGNKDVIVLMSGNAISDPHAAGLDCAFTKPVPKLELAQSLLRLLWEKYRAERLPKAAEKRSRGSRGRRDSGPVEVSSLPQKKEI